MRQSELVDADWRDDRNESRIHGGRDHFRIHIRDLTYATQVLAIDELLLHAQETAVAAGEADALPACLIHEFDDFSVKLAA